MNEKDESEINSPSHYTFGGLETIDILQKKLHPIELKGFLKGNVIKYITRGGHKEDELKDMKKALWYLNKMIVAIEKGLI